MRNILLCFAIYASVIPCTAQRMRPIEELLNTKDPGWPLVQGWIAAAKNKVEILPCDSAKAKVALYKTQVTTRSPMGAIVYATGGILVDGGWIRILGSGSNKLSRTLPEWNEGKAPNVGEKPAFYLIADDVIGGFFAINGGGLGADFGKVYYLAPDTLEWEAMGWTYSEFLLYCFSADLDKFYSGYRWKGWRKEVNTLSGDQSFNFFPPLFTKEVKDLTKSSRKPVPVAEQYSYTLDMRKQLGIK
jgi:uncharacterized protein DUF2625